MDRESGSRLACDGMILGIGMMKNEQELIVYHAAGAQGESVPRLSFSAHRKELVVSGYITSRGGPDLYRFVQKVAQIASIHEQKNGNDIDIIIQLKRPPRVARSATTQYELLSGGSWLRQTTIPTASQISGQPVSMLQHGVVIETGRWLSYAFKIRDVRQQRAWHLLSKELSMIPRRSEKITIRHGTAHTQWDWLRGGLGQKKAAKSTSSAMLDLTNSEVTLPYEIMYQLEVCISNGYLREPSLTHAFATKLASFDQETGIPGMTQNLLEYIAELKQWFPDPMDIFKHQHHVKAFKASPPTHCITLQSATITPTTIYFHTPTVEMSNRVLRKYNHYERHFLRVKFRDEQHLGRIMGCADASEDEVFARFLRALSRGIVVGNRKFEFLAYGNSQLREHGAYFFAPTAELCAEDIRQAIGVFSDIKVVAKYAARLGQAFSSTRTSWNQVDVTHIPDIERNGHCFTDGVGKMSPFVARIIADHIHLPTTEDFYPSAYQFRLAGYKGIIVVDKNLKDLGGRTIQLRPSQNKFPADHRGLEICRAAKYASSYLNQQIILLLSCLGVSDEAIVRKQQDMIADLQTAMRDEGMALKLLLKSVDHNETSIILATMVQDGFMRANEPFLLSCLRLWLSWSVKRLKEKAKILIPGGAFVLGGIDETGILSGHTDGANSDHAKSCEALPKIFLQTSIVDPTIPGRISTKIITGVCLVARNPSLHPGDVRIVEAVDVPQLRHLRNVVIFPQNGDRDIPGMCSGGDLDGDDYLVIWDPDIIPSEWNHGPMDYTPPAPRLLHRAITAKDIADFFVEHMKHDNLGRIATAHRYWADSKKEGAKHEYCLELAALHSCAVDYAKTGVPAKMSEDLRVRRWPRWAGKTNVSPDCIYDSDKILHQLYRRVDFVDFKPAQQLQYDKRILEAHNPNRDLLQAARELKIQYDASIRQLMSLHEIQSEYEVWTSFVLSHNDMSRDWSLKETLGEAVAAIKQQYRTLAIKAAGTTEHMQETSKLGPFIVAMYTITAEEAKAESGSVLDENGNLKLPLVSFPWLFHRELGYIAKAQHGWCTTKVEATQTPATMQEGSVTATPAPSLTPDLEIKEDDLASERVATPAVELSQDTTLDQNPSTAEDADVKGGDTVEQVDQKIASLIDRLAALVG